MLAHVYAAVITSEHAVLRGGENEIRVRLRNNQSLDGSALAAEITVWEAHPGRAAVQRAVDGVKVGWCCAGVSMRSALK